MQTCPFCSLHCDDLILELHAGQLVMLTPRCDLAESLYRQALTDCSKQHPDAWRQAVELLRSARRVSIILGGGVDQSAVRAAVRLARMKTSTLTNVNGSTADAIGSGIRLAGALQGTLGEIRRVGLAVVCGEDPCKTMPRIWEWMGEDLQRSAVSMPLENPIYTIRWLRLAHRDLQGWIPEELHRLIEMMQSTRSGVLLVGQDWLVSNPSLAVELGLLMKELGRNRRLYTLHVPAGANSLGVSEILLSETGFENHLRCVSGAFSYNPLECSRETGSNSDLVISVGNITSTELGSASGKRPIIILSPGLPGMHGGIWLQVGQPGIDAAGEMLRLDGVPVHIEPVRDGGRSTAAQAIDLLIQGASL